MQDMELKREHEILRKDLQKVWDDVLDSTGFIGGAAVEGFETAFAAFCEVKHAVGVGNGTDALLLALKALGIGPGDEVITAANSFVATAEAIVHSGATPVFVDIDHKTYNIDVNQIEDHITTRTKAIIPVHLYGQPADMDAVLSVAKIYGLSNDPSIAEAVRRLRDHGGLKKYEHDVVGHNSRLDSLQAAVLQIKLQHLEGRNEMRRQHARAYGELLSQTDGVVTPFEPTGVAGVYHLYVIRTERGSRDRLQEFLKNNGVQTGIHYPAPIHRTPAFASFCAYACPVAEGYAKRILSLPMYPEIERNQLEYVADLVSMRTFEGSQ